MGSEIRPLPASVVANLIQVADTLSDAIVFLDREWRITYANARAHTVSRLSAFDLNSKTHWELFPATVGTAVEQTYRFVMEERQEREIVFFYEPFQVWIDMRAIPIDDGIALHYRDITALKVAESNRDLAAQRLQQVLAATTDAIASLDRNWNFTYVNRRAAELLAPSGNVVGQNIWEIYPDALYEGSPFVQNYHEAMELREPRRFEAYYPEPLNLWFKVEAHPSEEGLILFFRDITEHRLFEEQLRQQQTETERQRMELEAVYRTAPIGLALFDPVTLRITRANDAQAEFIGLPREQILGKAIAEIAPAIPRVLELLTLAASGHPVRNQLVGGELPGAPGHERYWTVNYLPVYALDGSVEAISSAAIEVTQQIKSEAALRQSEKLAAVGRLASSISHEINNPLEAVTNLVYLARMHEGLPAELASYLASAQSELSRVSQIVTQTLRFHRQSVGSSWVSAGPLIDSVLDLYHGRFANSGIKVETFYEAAAPFRCFENDIRQVLNNLVANAVDAMRGGGRLTIRARNAFDSVTGASGIRISIGDNGHGMSRETQRRMYEPFFTTRDLNGTGLGLWISSEIVQRHQGRLAARSTQDPIRHGTVFTLFLPREP